MLHLKTPNGNSIDPKILLYRHFRLSCDKLALNLNEHEKKFEK